MASFAFVFGAPVFTEEDERREREDLTDAERRNLHNEVYGEEGEFVTETLLKRASCWKACCRCCAPVKVHRDVA
jgi:hypothetical protein